MKKPFQIVLLFLLCGLAQTAIAQVKFGVKAGLNLANVITDVDEVDPMILPTFQVGVLVDLGITENLAIETGVSMQGKGFKTEYEILGSKVKTTVNPLYLQVPAQLLFHTPRFFVGLGPYLGLGVAGRSKTEYLGKEDTDSIDFGSTEDDNWAALDFGLGIQAGVNVGAIRIGASYDFGLSDVIPKDQQDGDHHTNNSVISVFGAYIF